MADITVTAANVAASSDALTADGTAGETVTAGQSVYLKASDSRYWLADANASLAAAATSGITLNGAAAGQPIKIQTGGTINPGGTVVVGTVYVQSATAGGIAPNADSTTGWFKTIIGIGITASTIRLVIVPSGVAIP